MPHDPDLSSLFVTAAMDTFLSPKAFGDSFATVRELTDRVRQSKAIRLPVEAGTRVVFAGGFDACLGYMDAPDNGALGTVVGAKSAAGSITSHEDRVFVEWDTGGVESVYADHLRLAQQSPKKAASNLIRVASLRELTDFRKIANNALIHKSTQELWSLHQDGSGYVIQRLFDGEGAPLKG